MAGEEYATVVKDVETLFRAGTAAGLSDPELLERFVGRSEDGAEAAFAALVTRHGPMVLRVCRGELRDSHAAEDAFQATFLILARRARSIRKAGSLASWLYGVARRVAGRARVDRARRASRERRGAAMAEMRAVVRDDPPELLPEIQEELDRLPPKYRAPIVLCYLEGLTHEEAAGQLSVPVGTVKVRLSRGRERLRGRLTRRGLAPTLFAAALAAPARGGIPASLLDGTVAAAMRGAAVSTLGLSGPVAALVQGVLRAMFLDQLKAIAALAAASMTLILASFFVVSALSAPVPTGGNSPLRQGQDEPSVPPKAGPVPAPPVANRGRHINEPPVPGKAGPVPPRGDSGAVAVVTLKKSLFQRTVSQPANVQAFRSVEVYPKVSGELKSLAVDIGDPVKAGQVLAEIDAPALRGELVRAQAVVSQAKARLARVESAVRVAGAALATEHAKAAAAEAGLKQAEAAVPVRQVARDRMQALARSGAATQIQADEADQRLEAAAAAVTAAKSQLSVAQAGSRGAEARLEAARADVAEARAELDVSLADQHKADLLVGITRVTAPLDGFVTRRAYHVGDFVRSPTEGGSVPLLSIVQTGKIRVVVHVPDRDAPLLDKGDPITLHIDALPGREFRGTIARTAYAEDPISRALRAEIDLDNADGRLRPGQHGRVAIQLESRPGVLAIPSTAVLGPGYSASGALSCYRVVDGRALRTPIQVGDEWGAGGRVEVVAGLKEGDAVVANWRQIRQGGELQEGQEIRAAPAARVP
jgi:RND family efflux transporter MFP subunit